MVATTNQKRQRLNNDHLDLNFNNESLNIISNDKILGIFVDNNLTWSDHIKHLAKKNFFKYLAPTWFLKLKTSCLKLTEFSFTSHIFNQILTTVTLYGQAFQIPIN